MTSIPRRTAALAALTATLVLPALAGCGGADSKDGARGSGPAAPGVATTVASSYDGHTTPGDPGSLARERRIQAMTADCMKQSGFTYVAHVPAELLAPPIEEPTDYAAMKKERSADGFGIFLKYARPDDPHLRAGEGPADHNPNDAIRDGLDPAQRKVYQTTLFGDDLAQKAKGLPLGGCYGKAEQVVSPHARKLYADRMHKIITDQANSGGKRVKFDDPPALLNNPDLKKVENGYVNCLKGLGYEIEPDRAYPVTEIAQRPTLDALDRLTHGDIIGGKVDQATAANQLKAEIKSALEDLECGKDYFVLHEKLLTADRRAAGEIP
jgi:hypothetical protein